MRKRMPTSAMRRKRTRPNTMPLRYAPRSLDARYGINPSSNITLPHAAHLRRLGVPSANPCISSERVEREGTSRGSSAYFLRNASWILKMGRNTERTMPPTMMPMTPIMSGSISEVNDSTIDSTCWS